MWLERRAVESTLRLRYLRHLRVRHFQRLHLTYAEINVRLDIHTHLIACRKLRMNSLRLSRMNTYSSLHWWTIHFLPKSIKILYK